LCSIEPSLANGNVSGHRACFEKRLELPRFRPAIPVRNVGLNRTNKRTVATLGAKICIDAKTPAGDVHDRPSSVVKSFPFTFSDKQDVDIARVVEFVSSELSHSDYCDRTLAVLGKSPRFVKNISAERGECGADLVERVKTDEIAGRDAKELKIAPSEEIVGRGDGGDRPVVKVAEDVNGIAGPGIDESRQRAACCENGDQSLCKFGSATNALSERGRTLNEMCERRADRGRGSASIGKISELAWDWGRT
jgi:hypothetical protein